MIRYVIVLVVLGIVLIPVHAFDHLLFTLLNALHHRATDPFWLAATTLGDGLVLCVIIGAFVVIDPRVTALGLCVMVLASLATNSIKALFPTLRPVAVLESVHVIGPLLRSGAFPSGHAASAMAAGLSIAYLCRSTLVGISALCVAGLISVSRIFVGAHFPRDVIGGIMCALGLFILFVTLAWPKIREAIPDRPDFSMRLVRVLFSVEVAAALYLVFVHAPFHAESPAVACAVGIAVLVFLASRYRKLRSYTGTAQQISNGLPRE